MRLPGRDFAAQLALGFLRRDELRELVGEGRSHRLEAKFLLQSPAPRRLPPSRIAAGRRARDCDR